MIWMNPARWRLSFSNFSLYQPPNPHWVDGGYGVHVLEPGHWTNPEKEPEH